MRAALLLALSGLALAAPAHAATVDEDDHRTTVTLTRGEVLRVKLAENPSTGYAWEIVDRPRRRLLRFLGSRFDAPAQTDPPVAGAGGTRMWRWKARRSGRTTLRMTEFGPGRDRRVGDRFRLTIRVR
jgi:inhibitor of cysteine peptidase